jgi:hypothetical protein
MTGAEDCCLEAQGAAPASHCRRGCYQAIAKAEAVRGNAARLVRAPMLCLCKPPGQWALAARMLFVLREVRPELEVLMGS